MAERLAVLGPSASANDLLLDLRKNVALPRAGYTVADSGAVEDPLITALRRHGKLPKL